MLFAIFIFYLYLVTCLAFMRRTNYSILLFVTQPKNKGNSNTRLVGYLLQLTTVNSVFEVAAYIIKSIFKTCKYFLKSPCGL